MIEGLKVTINGVKLSGLCQACAEYHRGRADTYARQEQLLQGEGVERNTSLGDPVKNARDKQQEHLNKAAEMDFVAKYIDPNELYILSWEDLRRLNIVKGY